MKTAGMVVGTPDWQLDNMFENDLAKSVDEFFCDPIYADTIKDLKKVENELEEIEALLASAADDVSGTPEEDRITSIRYDLEQIEISIRHQRKRFEEMECGAE